MLVAVLSALVHVSQSYNNVSSQCAVTECRPRDCTDLLERGVNVTGVYKIFPEGSIGFDARCDMDTDDGGWTVFQRRINGHTNFYKTWNDYLLGFGNLNENFWLGNQNIALMSSQGWYEVRIDLTHPTTGERRYAAYHVFSLGNAKTKFSLFIDGYHGNAGDALSFHNNRQFSTKDRDNDATSGDCADLYHGGWWYKNCHDANLNGDYGNTAYAEGLVWKQWAGYYVSMSRSEMKIRRK
ncbi:ficolin-2-like [Mya arenaria]|uniref:ficolin-2-like n=1 Tax=Mya arenaria TaxID=6604 RepID=UPI0022DED7B9|nr:ficolin-2-like [Mya arenaria]